MCSQVVNYSYVAPLENRSLRDALSVGPSNTAEAAGGDDQAEKQAVEQLTGESQQQQDGSEEDEQPPPPKRSRRVAALVETAELAAPVAEKIADELSLNLMVDKAEVEEEEDEDLEGKEDEDEEEHAVLYDALFRDGYGEVIRALSDGLVRLQQLFAAAAHS